MNRCITHGLCVQLHEHMGGLADEMKQNPLPTLEAWNNAAS